MLIGILVGGNEEEAVSITSGQCIQSALNSLHIPNIIINTTPLLNITSTIHELNTIITNLLKCTKIINVTHGGLLEAGTSQKLLETLHLPHTSSSSQSSQILMNKYRTHLICQQLNINTPKTQLIPLQQYHAFKLPLSHMLKIPFAVGSSLGTHHITSQSQQSLHSSHLPHLHSSHPPHLHSSHTSHLHLPTTLQQQYHQEFLLNAHFRLISEFIHGHEYSCAIIHNKIFGGCLIKFNSSFCCYTTKYSTTSNLTHTSIPYNLHSLAHQANHMALQLYTHLRCSGTIRFDFILPHFNMHTYNKPYLLEANINPGMTTLSILPDIAHLHHNMNYTKFIQYLLH